MFFFRTRLSSRFVTFFLLPSSKQQMPLKETCLIPKGQLSGTITIRELEVEKADLIRERVCFFPAFPYFLYCLSLLLLNH